MRYIDNVEWVNSNVEAPSFESALYGLAWDQIQMTWLLQSVLRGVPYISNILLKNRNFTDGDAEWLYQFESDVQTIDWGPRGNTSTQQGAESMLVAPPCTCINNDSFLPSFVPSFCILVLQSAFTMSMHRSPTQAKAWSTSSGPQCTHTAWGPTTLRDS